MAYILNVIHEANTNSSEVVQSDKNEELLQSLLPDNVGHNNLASGMTTVELQ